MNKYERAHEVPDDVSRKRLLSIHILLNFTTLGIEVIKTFRKVLVLRFRNQKELQLFSSTTRTGK